MAASVTGRAARGSRRRAAAGLVLLLLAFGAAGVVLLRQPPDPTLRTITLDYPGPIAFDDSLGRAYLGVSSNGGPSSVRVLDLKTGATLHTIQTIAPVSALAVDERARHLFIGSSSSSNNVTMLDARTYSVLNVLGMTPADEIVADPRGGNVYVTSAGSVSCVNGSCISTDGAILTLDGRSGRVVRTVALPKQGWTSTTLADHGRRLLVIGRSSFSPRGTGLIGVRVFDAAGRLLRSVSLRGVIWRPLVADDTTGRIFGLSVPADNLLSVCRQTLITLDLRRNVPLRAVPLAGCLSSLAVDGQRGYLIVTNYGPLRQVTYAEPGGGAMTTLASTGPSSVQVYDARKGALPRTIGVDPAPMAVAVDERRGYLYVASRGRADAHGYYAQPGRVSVVDERSGKVLRSVAVGVNPVQLTLDARANRLFTFSMGSGVDVPAPDAWSWLPAWLRRWLPFVSRHQSRTYRIRGSVSILDTARLTHF